MFSATATLAALVLAATSVLAVPTYRRSDVPDRADWKNLNLESYYRFRTRYKNNGCADIQGSDWYNTCCVPLAQGETPDAKCTPTWCSAPASTSSSPVSVESPAATSSALVTSTSVAVVAPPATTTLASSSSSAPAATQTPVEQDSEDEEGEDDDDYDWVCEDDEEDTTSTPAPAPTVVDDGAEDDGDYDDDEDEDDLPFCDEVGDDYEPIYTTSTSTPATSTPAPEATTTQQPAPETTTAQSDTSNGDVQHGGFATFYYQNGNAGACGEKHGDDELIGAIDQDRYGYNFGVVSSECGRRVRITNTNNGKSVNITIKDVCPSCVNGNSIDLSKGAFLAIASEADGMVPIDWTYI